MTESLPKRVVVAEVLSSRYEPGERPVSWDDRSPGLETIRDASGVQHQLYSNGGQSTPAPGWELLLTKEASTQAEGAQPLEWTLYGIRVAE